MKVEITYHDETALTVEEVVKQAQHNYGQHVDVRVMPDSTIAYDLIYFGVQQLITHEHLSMLFDRDSNYPKEVADLRRGVLYKLQELVDQVIIDNEARVGVDA